MVKPIKQDFLILTEFGGLCVFFNVTGYVEFFYRLYINDLTLQDLTATRAWFTMHTVDNSFGM